METLLKHVARWFGTYAHSRTLFAPTTLEKFCCLFDGRFVSSKASTFLIVHHGPKLDNDIPRDRCHQQAVLPQAETAAQVLFPRSCGEAQRKVLYSKGLRRQFLGLRKPTARWPKKTTNRFCPYFAWLFFDSYHRIGSCCRKSFWFFLSWLYKKDDMTWAYSPSGHPPIWATTQSCHGDNLTRSEEKAATGKRTPQAKDAMPINCPCFWNPHFCVSI